MVRRIVAATVLPVVLVSVGCLGIPTIPSADTTPNDPVSYCSSLSASTFYCPTSIAMACSPNCLPNGWSGYCMVGSSRGNIGYSGISSNGGAFPVTTFLEDMHKLCYPGHGAPNVCVSISRCERR